MAAAMANAAQAVLSQISVHSPSATDKVRSLRTPSFLDTTFFPRKMAPRKKEIGYMNKYVYDAFLWTFSVLVELFFREVHPRGSWKVPKEGPVLFVCAPHANQFVDPLILMRVVKKESDRRIHVLIAEKSMKRKFIGTMAAASGAVPVGRAMDKTKPAPGRIYLPDPINDPCLVRGVDTNFETNEFQVGGTLVLPKVNNVAASAEILEIKGPEEIRLKRPFKGGVAMQQLTGRNDMTEDGTFVNGASSAPGPAPGYEGTPFLVAPKLNQTEVYDAVHTVLHRGGSIAIFPEGGSHDRTELLPLKAGVAIMSLGTVASKPDCNLKIIPVGMNYFHAHKFRSRAVIEFGNPIEVPVELAQKFQAGERREAIGQMLETIREGLLSVTVTAPDYETLMLIQAVRRLYNPRGTKLPLPRVVELNRRLILGYNKYKDDPRIVALKKEVLSYNQQILALGVKDHQVQYARVNFGLCAFLLLYRLLKLLVLSIFVVPGTILFCLVFIACKLYSKAKAKQALAESNVKVQAKDVLATWKLLVAIAVAPLVYTYYVVLGTWLYSYNQWYGLLPPGFRKRYFVLAQIIIYPTVTYAALRFGEVAMDIGKSLWPLIKVLNPWTGSELAKVQTRRERLAESITDIINELGPEMFDDFHSKRIISDPFTHSPPTTPPRRKSKAEAEKDVSQPDFAASPSSPSLDRNGLPKNESFTDLTNQDIFSTRPSTPKRRHSRKPSNGFGQGFQLKPFSSLDDDGLQQVTRKLKDGMNQRAQRRSSGPWQQGEESGPSTPGSEAGDEGLTMTKKER